MSVPVELRPSLKGFQGAEGDTALGTLEKQLLCPICLDIFTKPVVILPCQHNLCRKCANELYQPSLYQARTTMSVHSGRFRCPSCRQEVVLDRHGVYGLQRNLLVENIIDVYKQEVTNNSNNTTCCSLPPPQPQASETMTCSDHEGEKVNIYCLSCQVPTCSLCKVFGAHQSCEVAPLPDVYKQRKAELNEEVDTLVVVNNKVQAFINDLEDSCKSIEENCKTQKQSLCEKFERMFSILKERRKVMTQRISSEEEEKTGHLQTLVRCYGDSVEANTKLMEAAGRSMEEPNMADFVQNSRGLIAKVMTATSTCPVETRKADYDNMSHYTFNFKHQERALHGIDFIKAIEDVHEEPELESDPEPHLDEPHQSGALQQPLEPTGQNVEHKQYLGPTVQNLKTKNLLEPAIQNLEPKQPKEPIVLKHFEPTVQNLETHPAPAAALEPLSEPPVSSPVPTQNTVPVVSIIHSVGPNEPVMDLRPDGPVLEDQQGVHLLKKDETGGEKKIQEVSQPDLVKVIHPCEEQDGMSMQQFERGEAEHGTGDGKAINHAQTVSKEDEQMEAQEEEDGSAEREEEHDMFYPSWYRPNTWHGMSPGLASPTDILPTVYELVEDQIYSPDSSFAGEPLPVAVTQAKAQGSAKMQTQLQEQVPGSSLLPQFNTQDPPPLAPFVSAVQAQPQPQIPFEAQPESFPQQQNMCNIQQHPQKEPPLSCKSLAPDFPLFDHTQTQAYPPFSPSFPATQFHSQPPTHPVPTELGHFPEGLTGEISRDMEPMEEDNEDINGGWVYLSGAEEGGSGVGDGSMKVEENCSGLEESSANSEGITNSTSAEGNGAGPQLQGRFLELGEDDSLENDKNREELEDSGLWCGALSGLKVSASGMGCNAEATEMTDGLGEISVEPEERSAELDKDSLGPEEDSIPMEGSCNLDTGKPDLTESIDDSGVTTAEESQEQDSSVEEGRDSEPEFKQSDQELDEIRKQPEDSKSKTEEASGGDESGVNPTSSVCPQMETGTGSLSQTGPPLNSSSTSCTFSERPPRLSFSWLNHLYKKK